MSVGIVVEKRGVVAREYEKTKTRAVLSRKTKKRMDVKYEEIDFEKLDSSWRFKNKEEKLSRAKLLGYESIHEAYIGLYEKYQSTIVVGDIMGVGSSSIIKVMQNANILLGKRGGAPRVANISIPEKDILEQHGFDVWTASKAARYSKYNSDIAY